MPDQEETERYLLAAELGLRERETERDRENMGVSYC